jgi:hypothetical protein
MRKLDNWDYQLIYCCKKVYDEAVKSALRSTWRERCALPENCQFSLDALITEHLFMLLDELKLGSFTGLLRMIDFCEKFDKGSVQDYLYKFAILTFQSTEVAKIPGYAEWREKL